MYSLRLVGPTSPSPVKCRLKRGKENGEMRKNEMLSSEVLPAEKIGPSELPETISRNVTYHREINLRPSGRGVHSMSDAASSVFRKTLPDIRRTEVEQ